ncbi:MAG: class I SAM-dependent methyltransferase [Desulfobacteraceae bacterium]|nr:MAG: class I SAM-dependent methyltransferase [Desulfobacteraceae bacterium]
MEKNRIDPQKIRGLPEQALLDKGVFLYRMGYDLLPLNAVCLDLGCADGYGTSILSEKAKKIIGLDVDETSIKCARKNYISSGIGFDLYDGKTIPYPDHFFDFITAFHVIEHIKEDRRTIGEVFRVLKPGGLLLLATPNGSMRLPQGQPPWNVYHIREYDDEGLHQILSSHFSEVTIKGLGAEPHIIQAELRRIRRNIRIAALDVFYLRRVLPPSWVSALTRFIHQLQKKRKKEEKGPPRSFVESYTVENFNRQTSLDILAFCTKDRHRYLFPPQTEESRRPF